jgi:hypothetical protein
MKITLETPVIKQIVAPQSITLTELNVQRVVDLPEEKIVRCFIKELNEPLILWEAAAYDAAGQWTDTDVINRIIALINA